MIPRLKELYSKQIRPELKEKFNFKNSAGCFSNSFTNSFHDGITILLFLWPIQVV